MFNTTNLFYTFIRQGHYNERAWAYKSTSLLVFLPRGDSYSQQDWRFWENEWSTQDKRSQQNEKTQQDAHTKCQITQQGENFQFEQWCQQSHQHIKDPIYSGWVYRFNSEFHCISHIIYNHDIYYILFSLILLSNMSVFPSLLSMIKNRIRFPTTGHDIRWHLPFLTA